MSTTALINKHILVFVFVFVLFSDCTTITSPGYPADYNNSLDVNFPISAGYGHTIVITFDDFAVEPHATCGFDSLKVIK